MGEGVTVYDSVFGFDTYRATGTSVGGTNVFPVILTVPGNEDLVLLCTTTDIATPSKAGNGALDGAAVG